MSSPSASKESPNPNHYWRGQVWPRHGRILSDFHLIVAVIVSVIATLATWHLPIRDVPIATVAAAALAYAALSFGACVTGAVLALTVGTESQRRAWSAGGPPGSTFSHLSELVFVFTWAATAQFAVVVAAVLGFVLGGNLPMGPAHPLPTHVLLLACAYAVVVFALLELATVVFTLSQLGVVSDVASRAVGDESQSAATTVSENQI